MIMVVKRISGVASMFSIIRAGPWMTFPSCTLGAGKRAIL